MIADLTRVARLTSLDELVSLSLWAQPSVEILRDWMDYDTGHDEGHVLRVVKNTLMFMDWSHADADVAIPAAVLHDLINVPKDSPNRSKASVWSADEATRQLLVIRPFKHQDQCEAIHHAIVAHSYSAGVPCATEEARALQDADRIDALGCIGLARLFSVNGQFGRAICHPTDPLAEHRELDELAYGLDHIAAKLAGLVKTMNTQKGAECARTRVNVMIDFVIGFVSELEVFGDIEPRELETRVRRFFDRGTVLVPSSGGDNHVCIRGH